MKTIAIVGASSKRSRMSNKAVRAYQEAGYEVYPVHPTETEVEGLRVTSKLSDLPRIRYDRVSFYVRPEIGIGMIDDLDTLDVGEVWLNPGASSEDLVQALGAKGKAAIEKCSIVAIGRSPSEFPEA